MAKWFVYGKKADFKGISQKFGIDQVTARVMRNRDICTEEEIRRFLHADLSTLHAPEQLPGLEQAGELLLDKIDAGEKIRIIGDYDIGATRS